MSVAPRSLRVGLAGCGKMGSAMVQAWLGQHIVTTIDILDPHARAPAPDSSITMFTDAGPFSARAGNWDCLFLAIKPQTLEEFAAAITLPAWVPLISILAGKTIWGLAELLGPRPIIRAMPNTPAAIGKGMTVATGCPEVSPLIADIAEQLLSALGRVEFVNDEVLLDAATGLSGSGPAYIFYLIEALTKAGVDAGLPAELASKLARQTVIGSAALAEAEPGISPSTLRENVTSPNGTTAAGLEILMDGRFQDILTETVARAAARSRELAS